MRAELTESVKARQDCVILRLKREAEDMGSSHLARVQALIQLGKHLGMFTEKREISGSGGKPIEHHRTGDDESMSQASGQSRPA